MHVTTDLVRSALAHVPANLPRDEWARVAMAIKSEFPGEEGRALFDEWSATADGYDARAVRSTWRSVKAAGGVSIATLLHLAKSHGFKIAAPGAVETASTRRAAEDRAAEAAHELQRVEAAQSQAADEAARRWDKASDDGQGGYLQRKGVRAYGVRFTGDGWTLVPVRDAQGKLWNLQRLAPTKPASGSDKLFLKNGRKSGLWHWCGQPSAGGPLLVAEGYATAASLHEATGHAVAVAFDAGNLGKVARELQRLHPAALIVICGDDDHGTQARTGHNPGRAKAEAAARAVGGAVVFPGSPDWKDFNDMHQAAGIDAVAAHVAAQIEAHAGKARAPAADTAPDSDPFAVNDSGVWFTGRDQDGKAKPPEWVCSRLDVTALTRDQEGAGWGYLLHFTDPLGHAKQWAMPARMLSGDGAEYRAVLLNLGLRIEASTRAKNLLTRYIQTRKPAEFAQCTDRIGWHGMAFVLPRETLGDGAERIVFQIDGAIENTFTLRGSAADWRDRVGKLCAGNTRLVFAACCAFAGPLLRPAGMESGGFHFRGDSSSGKSTALIVAASVYGGDSFRQQWRATSNALEIIAAQHSDTLLVLDELSQVQPKEAGEIAYLLANSQSKARSTRTGQARARLVWRLLFLSSGEVSLSDHMAEGGQRARTGQEVRMADIPSDAGAGMGAFENLHGCDGGAMFAQLIKREALACYGATGRAFMEWACTHADTLARRVREGVATFAGQLVPEGASGQVERVGARFALVGVAGELATEAGLTGWGKGEAERAARACFNAWLAARGGIGNGEVSSMLRQVRRFLQAHGEGRFTVWNRAEDNHSPRTLQRAGFRRELNEGGGLIEYKAYEYFVFAEVFRMEVAAGFDYRAMARALEEADCLVVQQGRLTVKARLPGLGNAYCYHIKPRLFELDL